MAEQRQSNVKRADEVLNAEATAGEVRKRLLKAATLCDQVSRSADVVDSKLRQLNGTVVLTNDSFAFIQVYSIYSQ